MPRDFGYENNNIEYDYQYTEEDGGGIKCKNYEICDTILPKWWFVCKGNYLCLNCHMMFGEWTEKGGIKHYGKGELEIADNIECPICLEIKRGVSQPKCEHSVCINCFKRCYYGEEDEDNDPLFPYPDIEDEYYNDRENPKWDIEYPLIKQWDLLCDKWEEDKDIKYGNEEHLRKCPICRK